MKLRTKIILLNCIMLFLAMLVSDVVIWDICHDSLLQEAVQTSYAETYKIFDEFYTFVENMGEAVDANTISYFFKNREDDYTVCIKGENNGYEREYYNHTVFTPAVLNEQRFKDIDDDISYARMDWDGHELLCFFSSIKDSGFQMYHIVEISGVYEKLTLLLTGMAVMFVVAAAAAGVLLNIFLRRAFRPAGAVVGFGEKNCKRRL